MRKRIANQQWREDQLARLRAKAQQHRELQAKVAFLRAADPLAVEQLDGTRRYRVACSACSLPVYVSTTSVDGFETINYSACPTCGYSSWGGWQLCM